RNRAASCSGSGAANSTNSNPSVPSGFSHSDCAATACMSLLPASCHGVIRRSTVLRQCRTMFAITGLKLADCARIVHEQSIRRWIVHSLELDRYDRRLLRALQADARLRHVELAEQVRLSPSQCNRRLRKLEALGVIRGYTALLDRSRLGLQVM